MTIKDIFQEDVEKIVQKAIQQVPNCTKEMEDSIREYTTEAQLEVYKSMYGKWVETIISGTV